MNVAAFLVIPTTFSVSRKAFAAARRKVSGFSGGRSGSGLVCVAAAKTDMGDLNELNMCASSLKIKVEDTERTLSNLKSDLQGCLRDGKGDLEAIVTRFNVQKLDDSPGGFAFGAAYLMILLASRIFLYKSAMDAIDSAMECLEEVIITRN